MLNTKLKFFGAPLVIVLVLGVQISRAGEGDRRPRGAADHIVIKKSERRLFLMRGDRTLKIYRVALGRGPVGPKIYEGDNRTPEGHYLIDYRLPRSKFFKALHISYPNEQDRRRARITGLPVGGDIVIHGMPNDLGIISDFLERNFPDYRKSTENTVYWALQFIDWTRGCIALNNQDISELYDEVGDGTPVEILP